MLKINKKYFYLIRIGIYRPVVES